jgi:beta-xylosidase
MLKRNGEYYFMWSEGNWTDSTYRVSYARSASPLGPFTTGACILRGDPAVGNGAGHHSVLNIPGTDDWYICYHRRPIDETDGNHRVTCIDRMYFDGDGNILPVAVTKEGVARRLPAG